MPDQKMEETQERKRLASPFGSEFPKTKNFKKSKCDDRFMINLKVKVNEDHTVSPDESDKVDLVELIQTYKDQCGMEMAKKLIKIGQAQPGDFADDGKHSVDCTLLPQNPQQAANLAVAAGKQTEALRNQFGLPDTELSGEQLEAMLNAYFSKHPEFIKQPEKAKEAE